MTASRGARPRSADLRGRQPPRRPSAVDLLARFLAPSLALLFVMAIPAAAGAPPTTAAEVGGCAGTVAERVLQGDPTNYRALLPTLVPGDLLELTAGDYTQGLPLVDVHGESGRCIVIAGPEAWPPLVRFEVRTCCNTISLSDSSYLVLRNLEVDGTGDTVSADGVKAESTSTAVHHVTLERLWIHDHDLSQQTVGISTKCPAWNWVVRESVVERCGTGMYFGDSTGGAELVAGLLEHNLVRETTGYNVQIKHQNGRATGLGAPASAVTVIRHNVFSKATGSATGDDARPNLLVGHWPLAGPGSDDDYLVYGNLFWQNGTGAEALFQGEGNVALYDNLFVNDFGPAVAIQPHEDVPRRARVFRNTVIAATTGLRLTGAVGAADPRVVGNAVFAGTPLSTGAGVTVVDNATGTVAEAAASLVAPDGLPGGVPALDLYPLGGALAGAVDPTGIDGYEHFARDFNGRLRLLPRRGAYGGDGTNPGWLPALQRKPEVYHLFSGGFESGTLAGWASSG